MSVHTWKASRYVGMFHSKSGIEYKTIQDIIIRIEEVTDSMTHPFIYVQNHTQTLEKIGILPCSVEVWKRSDTEYWFKYKSSENQFKRFQIHFQDLLASKCLIEVLERLLVGIKDDNHVSKKLRLDEPLSQSICSVKESQTIFATQLPSIEDSQGAFSVVQESRLSHIPDSNTPALLDWSSNQKCVIEKVVDKRIAAGKLQYFVKWIGWSIDHCSWKEFDASWDEQEKSKALEYERSLIIPSQPIENTLVNKSIGFLIDLNAVSDQVLTEWIESQNVTEIKGILSQNEQLWIEKIRKLLGE